EQMSRDGVRRALVFATSAWGGYSACLQYNEDIRRMIAHLEEQGVEPVEFTKLRQFYDHPTFVRLMADAVRESLDKVPAERRGTTRVLFTAHSVPSAADEDRKSTRLNSSHVSISYAVFFLKKEITAIS